MRLRGGFCANAVISMRKASVLGMHSVSVSTFFKAEAAEKLTRILALYIPLRLTLRDSSNSV